MKEKERSGHHSDAKRRSSPKSDWADKRAAIADKIKSLDMIIILCCAKAGCTSTLRIHQKPLSGIEHCPEEDGV